MTSLMVVHEVLITDQRKVYKNNYIHLLLIHSPLASFSFSCLESLPPRPAHKKHVTICTQDDDPVPDTLGPFSLILNHYRDITT